MHEDRYIQVEENVYIDTKGGLTPPQRALIAKALTYGIGLVMLCSLIFAVLGSLNRARPNARRVACQSNLKQIAVGIAQYTEDNGNRYPLVAVNNVKYSNVPSDPPPYGWADAIQPYLKSMALYSCPDGYDNHEYDPTRRGYIDYWFNRKLSQVMTKTVADPTYNLMLGDGQAGGNARASLDALPAAWKADETSPLWRHWGGANYAFADGHVEWLSGDTDFVSRQYHFRPQEYHFAPR